MDPNEHIVEQYISLVKKWSTRTNLGYGNSREIDIVAVDKDKNVYHIEVDIHKVSRAHWAGGGSRKVPAYVEKKFSKAAASFIRKEYKTRRVKRVWVCWGILESKRDHVSREAADNGLEIWEFKKIIPEMIAAVGTRQYRDPVLQFISQLKLAFFKR